MHGQQNIEINYLKAHHGTVLGRESSAI